jgi:PBP1b-binding outer membrane lipoprotein LpoB
MSMSQRQRDLLYRLSARHILEDLEAQSPRRTQSWGANSLHSSQSPYDDNVHADEEDEFEVKYDDGVTQIRVRVDNNKQSDSSNKKAEGGGRRCKTSHFIILLTPLAIAAIIAGSMLLFGPNSRNNKPNGNDRTINAGNDMEDSINSSGGEDEVTGVLIPTLAPTMNATTGIVESVTVYTVNETSLTYTPSVAPITDAPTVFVSTSPTVADIVDIITTTEATTTSIATTDATGDFTTEEVVLVDGSMSSNNETALIEEEVNEAATITTTIAPALETATTVAAISAHLCTNIPSGKIFKIDITPKSSTTSLELFQLQNGEYKLVTAYPTVDDEFQELSAGENYIKKLCVLPGSYKFVVKESNGACYEGFFRGNSIFENCGNGEHDFEWVGSTGSG